MKYSRQGPLYVPEHDGVRGYRPSDVDRYRRHLDWRERQQRPKCAAAFVQAGQAETGGTNTTVNLTLTAGNFIWVAAVGSIGTLSITETVGSDSFTAANAAHSSGTNTAASWFCASVGGGSTTIKVTDTSSANQLGFIVMEFSGMAASPSDQTAVLDSALSSGLQTLDSGTTGTVAQNDEIILSFWGCCNSGNVTWASLAPYTIPTNGSQTFTNYCSAGEYQIVSASPTTYKPQVTITAPAGTTNMTGMAATFKAAASATDSQEWLNRLPTMTGPRIKNVGY